MPGLPWRVVDHDPASMRETTPADTASYDQRHAHSLDTLRRCRTYALVGITDQGDLVAQTCFPGVDLRDALLVAEALYDVARTIAEDIASAIKQREEGGDTG